MDAMMQTWKQKEKKNLRIFHYQVGAVTVNATITPTVKSDHTMQAYLLTKKTCKTGDVKKEKRRRGEGRCFV